MATKTYAMRAKDKPDWMVIAPIHPLTVTQWKAAFAVIQLLNEQNAWSWVGVYRVAVRAGVSESTARAALKKLVDMGLLRRVGHRNGGFAYYRKIAA